MNRPDPSDDLRLEVAAGTLLLPVLLGVIAGVVLGLVSLFTLGRLTIGKLYPMGGTGVALNAALGGVAAAVIGVAARG